MNIYKNSTKCVVSGTILDVAQIDSVVGYAKTLEEVHGKIDIVINMAGSNALHFARSP